jgi:hypothetical protein
VEGSYANGKMWLADGVEDETALERGGGGADDEE